MKRGIEIRSHGQGAYGGQLYLGVGEDYKVSLAPGNYTFEFKIVGWSWNGGACKGTEVYMLPYDEQFASATSAPPAYSLDDTIQLGIISNDIVNQSKYKMDDGKLQDVNYEIPAALTYKYNFTVSGTSKDYIFAFQGLGRGWDQGCFVGDFKLYDPENPPSIADDYIIRLNKAVNAAMEKETAAKAATKYAGSALNDISAKINTYKIGGAFDDTKATAPSVWNAAIKEVTDATNEMQLRMDTVNLLDKTAGDVATKLAACTGDTAQLKAYEVLVASKAVYDNSYPYSSKTNSELSAFVKTLEDQMKAIDTRINSIHDWDSLMVIANALITAKEKEAYPEYTALKDVINGIAAKFEWSSTDEDFFAKFKNVEDAVYAYSSIVELEKVAKKRIVELQALATKYGTNVADSSFVKAALADLRGDADDYLALVFKSYIKAAMYDKIANGGGITSEDLSPFMKNYYLYATPIVDNPYVKEATKGGATSTVPSTENKKYENSNVYHLKHNSNSTDIWVIFFSEDITNLYPGWTVYVHSSGGVTNVNNIVTPDIQTTDDFNDEERYPNFKKGLVAFDGALTMDWGSSAELSTEVTTLPVGEYDLGVEHRALYRANSYDYDGKDRTKNAGTVKLDVTTAKSPLLYAKTFYGGYYGPDSTALLRESTGLKDSIVALKAIKSDTVFDTIKVRKLEKIAIAEDDTLRLVAVLSSGNGNDRIDNFSLTFKPKTGYDYAAAATAAKNEAISILTVVDAAKSIADKVEYYSLSGMKLNAPKRGEILVRKRTLANGKVVVDKVLIK